MPEWMDKCVAAYKRDHPKQKDVEDHAWAVCTTAYKKKFGHAPSREDVAMHIRMLQEQAASEGITLTFSDDEKRQLLQRAVSDHFGDEGDLLTGGPYITSVYNDHVVVYHGGEINRMFAVPYELVDKHTVDLGDPVEVVAAYVGEEVEILYLLLFEGWLPAGTTQNDLDDGDFAWLSHAYRRASADEREKMNKRKHRKLPYKIHGKVNLNGWLAAWKAIRWTTYLRPSLRGGPGRDEVMSKLKRDKPSKVKLDKEGHVTVREAVDEATQSGDVMLEAVVADFIVEESDDGKFAATISGTVIPEPDNEIGVKSRNRRIYPAEAVDKIFDLSTTFLEEGGVATVFSSHSASFPAAGHLPIGRVLDYSRQGCAVRFRAGLVDTSEGSDVTKLIEAGVLDRVSLRTREWESEYEEVPDLGGKWEVMKWCVIHGIDFTTVPGLDNTNVTKEEVEMELTDLTLAELQEQRPDLVQEIVVTATADIEQPEPVVDEEAQLRLAVLEAACTGVSSIVAKYLMEHVESAEQIPDHIEEARTQALSTLMAPARAANFRGVGGAPEHNEEAPDQEELSETQKYIVRAGGGRVD